MKRNDIFMWAYISFIFVCIILRMNWAFPLWGAVVIAITISSVFFATEDLLSSVARFLQETCDVADKFIETAKKGIAKDREFLDKIGKNAELLKNEEYNISDVNISFDSVRNWVSELESYVSSFENSIDQKKRRKKSYQICANAMAYLGFLSLFCILIIASMDTVSILEQELLTVLAFGIILVTQQINIISKKKIKKDIVNSEQALQAQQELRQSIHQSEGDFDYLLNLVERLNSWERLGEHGNSETEANDHAD